MALFKPFRGTRAALNALDKHDGYAYFCTDDGTFHIDYVDSDGNLQRKQINEDYIKQMIDSFSEDLQYQIDIIAEKANAQPNWNQNNPSAPDYIENRTHYTTNEVKLIPLVDEEIECNGDTPFNTYFKITIGKTYIVVFDGVEYECVGYDDSEIPTIGAPYQNFENYPFGIWDDNSGVPTLTAQADGPHVVQISEKEIVEIAHKLDSKYLPDEIFTTPNWNQNDTTQADYIINRTHFDIDLGDIVDNNDYSNTESLERFEGRWGVGDYYTKVSDIVPSMDVLLSGVKYTQNYNGTVERVMGEHNDEAFVEEETGMILCGQLADWIGPAFIVVYDGVKAGMTYDCDISNGIYFGSRKDIKTGVSAQTTKITFPAAKILDEKYLPKLADVAKTGSYNDLTDKPEIQTVQPDWNQNDETQPDYIKNRTHYTAPSTLHIAWDGDETGRHVWELSPAIHLTKVSNDVHAYEDLIGGTIQLTSRIDGTIVKEIIVDRTMLEIIDDCAIGVTDVDNDFPVALIVISADDVCESVGVPLGTFETGVYICNNLEQNVFVSKFSGNEVIVKINEKYLPDGLMTNKIVNQLTYQIIDGAVQITSVYNSDLTVCILPDTIEGYPVTSIGDYAFRDCRSLTSVTIPDSVTSIGDGAFLDCLSLKNIKIPNGVTTIGAGVFNNCPGLTSVTIGNSVTSIEGCAFIGCTSLTSITIPDSVTSIYGHAFSDCKSLTSITIPDSVTSIGDMAFRDCSSLTDVYYKGTQEQWSHITIGSDNDPLANATIHYNQALATKEYVNTNISNFTLPIIDTLPKASHDMRGHMIIVPEGNSDKIYVCLRVNGAYTWVTFNGNNGDNDNTTTSILGQATLGSLILGKE